MDVTNDNVLQFLLLQLAIYAINTCKHSITDLLFVPIDAIMVGVVVSATSAFLVVLVVSRDNYKGSHAV